MMSVNSTTIGFKPQTGLVELINQNKSNDYSIEDVIKQKGFNEALEYLRQYFDMATFPFVKDEDRDKLFMSKFAKIKARYFDEI